MFDQSMPFFNYTKIPAKMGLYGIYKDDVLLYIGLSSNLKSRFTNHHKINLFIFYNANLIKFKIYSNIEKLHFDEYWYINLHNPVLNKHKTQQYISNKKINENSLRAYATKIAEKCTRSKLQKLTIRVGWEYVLKRQDSFTNTILYIEKETGLSKSWIHKILTNPNFGPDIGRTETLACFCGYDELKKLYPEIYI